MMKETIEEFYKGLSLFRKIIIPEGQHFTSHAINIKEIPIHFHNMVELLFVLKGNIDVKISFHQYTLKAGDFLLINPFEVHTLTPREDDTLMIAMHIRLDQFTTEFFIFDHYYYNNMDQDIMKDVKALMIDTYIASMKNDTKKINESLSGITRICDNYFPMHRHNVTEKKVNPSIINDYKTERIDQLYRYMYFDYPEKLRLNTFAKKEYIDQYYASRLIKNETGDSFQNAISMIRIDRAEPYLLGTDMPIQEIYEALGFSSYDYFNKQFKMNFGMSASAFRKKYKPLSYPQKEMKFNILYLADSDILVQMSKF